jgi:hypothetical protein
MPCSNQHAAPVRERRPEPVVVAVAVREQRSVPALVQAEVPASVQAQQRPRRRQVRFAPAASSPAAARTPCSDRQVAPVQQRRPELVAAVRERRSAQAAVLVQAEVPVSAQAAAAQPQRP